MSRRLFSSKGFVHICQISVDGGVIFYSKEDYLVFFTIMCVVAKKYGVRITAFCIMRNHFHIQAQFTSKSQMSSFINSLTSTFARVYNNKYKIEGKMFKHSYRSVSKITDKKIAENNYYICNNAKVKLYSNNCEDYRWGFLKNMFNDHPFSKELNFETASPTLIMAVSEVKKLVGLNIYIHYSFFKKYQLMPEEYEQLCDYIVTSFNVIDYQPFIQKHGSPEKYIETVNILSGSEYDLADDCTQEDYRHYDKMDAIVPMNPLTMSLEEKRYWDSEIKEKVKCTAYERAKYLHLPVETLTNYKKISSWGGYPENMDVSS